MKQLVIQLLKQTAWAPIGVVFLHEICGELFGREPYVDPAVHFLGGAAITYFLRTAAVLSVKYIGHPTELGFDIGAFGLACIAAVFWEFGEWFSDGFLGTNIQRSGGAPLRDLAIGLGDFRKRSYGVRVGILR